MRLKVFVVMILLCSGCALNKQNNGLADELAVFEKKYAATLSSDEKEVKLIGFNTAQIEPEFRDKIKVVQDSMSKTEFAKNMYFAKDFSYYRMYFPMHTAIISYNDVHYTANEKGIVLIPDLDDISKIKVIGRKKSETVTGGGNDVIDGDKILFKNELKQEVKDGVKTGYSYPKERMCVFSLGQR
jgi:hypothetical protein